MPGLTASIAQGVSSWFTYANVTATVGLALWVATLALQTARDRRDRGRLRLTYIGAGTGYDGERTLDSCLFDIANVGGRALTVTELRVCHGLRQWRCQILPPLATQPQSRPMQESVPWFAWAWKIAVVDTSGRQHRMSARELWRASSHLRRIVKQRQQHA